MAERLEKDSLKVFECALNESFKLAARTLKEVERANNEEFRLSRGIEPPKRTDSYSGVSMLEQLELKKAKDQLRKAIENRNPTEVPTTATTD